MNPFKKIKQLLAFAAKEDAADKSADDRRDNANRSKSSTSNNTDSNTDSKNTEHTADPDAPDYSHLTPIANRLNDFFCDNDWKFERISDKSNASVGFYMGFVNENFRWHCSVRTFERSHLITFIGILTENLPETHLAAAVTEIAELNERLNFGNLNIDLDTGSLYGKISVDGEFSTLSDRALHTYMYALITICDRALQIYQRVMALDNPPEKLQLLTKTQIETEGDDGVIVVVDGTH